MNTAALYMRLSKEDTDSTESVSIENQRKILRAYARAQGFLVYDEYIDDGWSGTHMERPALCRMQADIACGKIGVVITKDFSRLGRNTGQVMTMLDDYFVKHNVRYIAVSEGIDTQESGTCSLLAPVLGFTSEMYAGDISRKINASFRAKMENGEFIGAFAPYGYRKDPENKNHLLPHTITGEIVKQIFSYAKDGCAPKQIAEILNRNGVLTPSAYRRANVCAAEWTASGVGKLLRNEVYLGHTLQGKTHKPSFKSQYIATVPKSDWIRVEHTHVALVDAETWEIVRKRMQSRARVRESGFENIFSGLAKCADCGKNMSTVGTRKKGARANLNCGNYKLNGAKSCTNHTIDYDTLYNMVLKALREQIRFTAEEKSSLPDEMLVSMDTSGIAEAKKKLSQTESKRGRLFDSKFSGEIDDDTFRKLYTKYEKERVQYAQMVSAYENDGKNTEDRKRRYDILQDMIAAYENIEFLDSALLFKLIARIDVHQGTYVQGVKEQQIDIYFKFRAPAHN